MAGEKVVGNQSYMRIELISPFRARVARPWKLAGAGSVRSTGFMLRPCLLIDRIWLKIITVCMAKVSISQ